MYRLESYGDVIVSIHDDEAAAASAAALGGDRTIVREWTRLHARPWMLRRGLLPPTGGRRVA